MRSWVLPEEPVPVRLMSTIWADTDGLHDDLAAPRDLDAWLDAVRVDRRGRAATRDELDRARKLRDAVRRLAAHVTADDRPAAASAIDDAAVAIEAVNSVAALRPAARLAMSGDVLSLGREAVDSAVTTGLAGVAAEAQHLLGEKGDTLRACHAPGCVLYFVKTHPRRAWCSVACGNRARAARHYQSVRDARSSSGDG